MYVCAIWFPESAGFEENYTIHNRLRRPYKALYSEVATVHDWLHELYYKAIIATQNILIPVHTYYYPTATTDHVTTGSKTLYTPSKSTSTAKTCQSIRTNLNVETIDTFSVFYLDVELFSKCCCYKKQTKCRMISLNGEQKKLFF